MTVLLLSLLAFAASFLGARAARGAVFRIPQRLYRPVVALFLLLAGLRLLITP